MQRGKKIESVVLVNALQRKGRSTARQSIWAVLTNFCTAYAHKLLTVSFQSEF